MNKVLCGLETEYGLSIVGRGAETQIEDSMALVRSNPYQRCSIWDYEWESPRRDLRGFSVDRLQADPVDAQMGFGEHLGSAQDVRSDQILSNGARLYNDHGHPEYATPESWSIHEAARLDHLGAQIVWKVAQEFAQRTGYEVRMYRNNTDFHGSSYGSHESYLMPREIGWQACYEALLPLLVVRPIVCGAGKVGSESHTPCHFQLSQRADFFAEPLNVDTLYRRPIFNTRDEPHADPEKWMRVHVIAGDVNMNPMSTLMKVGLAQIALLLAVRGQAPIWRLADPVRAAQAISRDASLQFELKLENGSWTTGYEIIESYLSAAEATGLANENADFGNQISPCRQVLESIQGDQKFAAQNVDWVAKKQMIESFQSEMGWPDGDSRLQAFDLEYHNINPSEGLYFGLVEMGSVPRWLSEDLWHTPMNSRAALRAYAIRNFPDQLVSASWRSLTFRQGEGALRVELPVEFDREMILPEGASIEEFLAYSKSSDDHQN